MKFYKEQIGVVMETRYYIMVQSYYSCRQQVFPSGMVAMAFVAWKLSLDHISWPISASQLKKDKTIAQKVWATRAVNTFVKTHYTKKYLK